MPTLVLLVLQVFDIGLHIVTDQFELIRVISNGVAVGGAILILFAAQRARAIGGAAGLTYLALNGVFLAQSGITNPATDALRLPLFGFVASTLIALYFCVRQAEKSGNKAQAS